MVNLAGLIVLLHGLVPHQHHNELSYDQDAVQHASANDLQDYLELVFHIDMGDGHLDHFENVDGIEFDVKAVAINLTCFSTVSQYGKYDNSCGSFYKHGFPELNKYSSGPEIACTTLRGPPSIS